MSDVFLSYAHEDRDLAERLASRLEREGWTVWWDRALPVGRDFDRTIGEALDSATCVVVVWSRWSAQSEYVRDEAQVALDRGRLVPVAVGGAQPPLGFRRRQTLLLDDARSELEAVVTAVAETISRPVSEWPVERAAVRKRRIGVLKLFLGTAIAVSALLLGLGAGADLGAEVSALPPAVWVVLASLPLLAVVAGHLLPAVLSRFRAHRLSALASLPGARASYFQVTPYSSAETDQKRFRRLDGVHREVLAWLKSGPGGVRYLTGASGSGKTSLLASYVLPRLPADGAWQAITIRGFRDPLGDLLRQLRAVGEATDRAGGRATPSAVMAAIDGWIVGHPDQKLLVVFDQFEELLILHQRDPERLQAVEELLRRLTERPPQRLVLLVVLRSDYVGLLHELEQRDVLPPMDHGSNWREVPPFKERDAWRFLDESGLRLGPRVRERLFREVADIEETRGLVRPITLNMVGLVLDRGGGKRIRARRRPSRSGLLTEYLESCLRRGEVRDHAPAVLAPMLTRGGTKHPRTVAELSEQSGFASSVVAGCLAQLGADGLVRRLDAEEGLWEVSHDFVARLLAIVLGRRRRGFAQAAAAWSLPASLAVWLGAFLLLPSLLVERVAPDRITARVSYSGHGDSIDVPELDAGAVLQLGLRRRMGTTAEPPGRWLAGVHNAAALLMVEPEARLEAKQESSTQETQGTPDVPFLVRVSMFSGTSGRLGPFARRAEWGDAEIEAVVVSRPPGQALHALRENQYGYLVDPNDSWSVKQFNKLYSLPDGYLREHGPFIGDEDLGDILQPLALDATLELMVGGETIATGRGIPVLLTQVREDWSRTEFVVRFLDLAPMAASSGSP